MSEANNWKWISSPPDYVRNLVEELRVKGEEGAAEMLKNYVEELHLNHAEKVMLKAKYDFLYIENKRLKAALVRVKQFTKGGPDHVSDDDITEIFKTVDAALGGAS